MYESANLYPQELLTEIEGSLIARFPFGIFHMISRASLRLGVALQWAASFCAPEDILNQYMGLAIAPSLHLELALIVDLTLAVDYAVALDHTLEIIV